MATDDDRACPDTPGRPVRLAAAASSRAPRPILVRDIPADATACRHHSHPAGDLALAARSTAIAVAAAVRLSELPRPATAYRHLHHSGIGLASAARAAVGRVHLDVVLQSQSHWARQTAGRRTSFRSPNVASAARTNLGSLLQPKPDW